MGVAALLAGCTSSGIAYNPPFGGNVVTVIVIGNPVEAPTIAYETGTNGTWKFLPTGQTTFTVDNGTAYGVAFYCNGEEEEGSTGTRSPQEDNSGPTGVFQATTTEINVVPVPCGDPYSASLSGTFDATAFESTSYVVLDGTEYYGATGSYETSVIPGTQDIISGAFDESNDVLAVKNYEAVNVPSGGLTQNITFGAGDAVGATKSFSLTNVPGTATDTYTDVDFGNVNWAELNLTYNDESTSVNYPTVAAADVDSNDSYYGFGYSDLDGPGNASWVEHDTFASSLPASIAEPAPFNEPDPATVGNPTFALNYTGYDSLPSNFSGYELDVFWDGESDEGENIIFVSSGFLHALGTTNYTAPNITLAGWQQMTASSGDGVSWSATAVYGNPEYLAFYAYDNADAIAHSPGAQSRLTLRGMGGAFRVMQAQRAAAKSRTHTGVHVQSGTSSSETTQGATTLAVPTTGDGYWASSEDCYTVGGGTGCG